MTTPNTSPDALEQFARKGSPTMNKFSAEEVRTYASEWAEYGEHDIAEMLTAYADLLERMEREKPVTEYDPRSSVTVHTDTTTLQRNHTHPAPAQTSVPDVDAMVTAFLGWKLPENFSPDCGISFTPEYNIEFMAKQGKSPMRHEPMGTNLFDANQARAMIEHMLAAAKENGRG